MPKVSRAPIFKQRSLLTTVILCLLFSTGCTGPIYYAGQDALKPHGADDVTVMDFSQPISLDPIAPGWYHYTFFWHGPMQINFVTKDSVPAVRLRTANSASILFRQVDIDLQTYPILRWNWLVEQSITSSRNERYWWGDDHAARLVILFETDSGKKRNMELIWGNRLEAGEFTYTSFSHLYVVRSGTADQNRWLAEKVNLLQLYHRIWADQTPVKIRAIGIFSDSDNTGGATVCYFSKITMHRQLTR